LKPTSWQAIPFPVFSFPALLSVKSFCLRSIQTLNSSDLDSFKAVSQSRFSSGETLGVFSLLNAFAPMLNVEQILHFSQTASQSRLVHQVVSGPQSDTLYSLWLFWQVVFNVLTPQTISGTRRIQNLN